jgi:RND family efflux transporter MFP subunit
MISISALKTYLPRIYNYRYKILGIAVTVIVCILFFKHQPSVTPEPHRLVRIIALQNCDSSTMRFTGTVHAQTESGLGFRVNGKIIEKLVDEGTNVKKGQLLMRLDPMDLKLAYSASTQSMEAAKAQNVRAIKEVKRMHELLRADAISQQEYEQAKSDADVSSSLLKAAIAQEKVASNTSDYTELHADADGVIISVPADVGQVVTAGQIVIRLAHNNSREAVINLPENALDMAEKATNAILYTNPNTVIPIKLREVSAMADPLTRTYQAKYTLQKGTNAPLGSTITVNFETKLKNGVTYFLIPLGALYDIGQGSSIWIFDDISSTVNLLPVKVYSLSEETVCISGELKAGEHVVALGAHLLKPGEIVRVERNEEKPQNE